MNEGVNESSYTRALMNQQIVLSIAAGVMALIIYDTCITLSRERQFVWETRWSVGKLLYLFIRYGTVVIAISGFYGSLYVDPSMPMCRTLTQSFTAGACVLRLVIDVNQLLRAVAVFSDDRKKRMLLVVISIPQLIVLCGLSVKLVASYELIEYGFSVSSCALLVTYPKRIYVAFYTFVLVPDLIISATCSFKIFQLWTGGESRLARIILRDSVVYMIALTLLAIPQFLTPFFLPTNSTIIVTGLNFIIITMSGIASSRMNLNVRSEVLDPHDFDLDIIDRTYTTFHTTASISRICFDCTKDHSRPVFPDNVVTP